PPPVAATFSPDGRLVLTPGGRDVKVWTARSGRLLVTLHSSGALSGASFGPFGSRVIAAGDDWVARVWTIGGRVVAQLRNPGPVRAAALSPDGKRAVTLAEDAAGHVEARIFDLDSGRVLHVLPERGLLVAAFSP